MAVGYLDIEETDKQFLREEIMLKAECRVNRHSAFFRLVVVLCHAELVEAQS